MRNWLLEKKVLCNHRIPFETPERTGTRIGSYYTSFIRIKRGGWIFIYDTSVNGASDLRIEFKPIIKLIPTTKHSRIYFHYVYEILRPLNCDYLSNNQVFVVASVISYLVNTLI